MGILKGWFVRATDAALENSARTLTIDHLKQNEPADAEWRSIATTLLEGEEALRESEADIESLQLRLQQETSTAKTNQGMKALAAATQTTQTGSRSRRPPGERLPRRDPIGKSE